VKKYDVAIIGSGPAAMSAAITLAKHGCGTALFHRAHANSQKSLFGEMLSRSIMPDLARIGMVSSFRRLGLTAIDGSISSWGSNKTEETSRLLHPTGLGWVFRRNSFEQCLAQKAKEDGVSCFTTGIESLRRQKNRWEISHGYKWNLVRDFSDLLIVATGRDTFRRPKMPPKLPLDRLVACVISTEDKETTHFSNLISVDASENGWFFSLRLDNGIRVISYFTDGDLLPGRKLPQFCELLNERLPYLPSISKTVKALDPIKVRSFCIVSTNSSFRKTFFCDGLLFCGDSAQTFDPLSSQGISTAVREGIEIGELAADICGGNQSGLIEHEKRRRTRYADYLRSHHNIYKSEKRWRNSLFWRRRQDTESLRTFLGRISNGIST